VGTEGSAVAIGIDAAVVADHHVMVRQRDAQGPGTVLEEFTVAPTLVGMERLAKKLSAYPGAVAVAEPTSMTWLPLALALDEAGCSFALVGNRHAGRLRGALAGRTSPTSSTPRCCRGPGSSSPSLKPASLMPPSWRCDERSCCATRRCSTPTAPVDAYSRRPGGPIPMSGSPSGVRGPLRWRCSGDGRTSGRWPGLGCRR
jgi:hypothetical protein